MKMIGAFLLFFGPALAFAQEGYLENPQPDATESGIGAISGWHCTAQNITVLIDGNSLGKAGSGTSRRDVAGICGRSDTGFSLLFNYNVLSQGPHTIRVYADGNVLAERQFKSVKSGRQEFLAGVNKSLALPSQSCRRVDMRLAAGPHEHWAFACLSLRVCYMNEHAHIRTRSRRPSLSHRGAVSVGFATTALGGASGCARAGYAPSSGRSRCHLHGWHACAG